MHPLRTFLCASLLLAGAADAQEGGPRSRPAEGSGGPASRPTGRPGAPASRPAAGDPWARFRRLLPRGRIAGIRKPRFVSAKEARIRPEAWVLGVVVEGEARAYSLNLLNRHEVVNDEVGGVPFAAVW